MHENYDIEQLLELVETKQFRRLKELLSEMNEVDIAEFMDEVPPEKLIVVFRLLPKELAADVFTYLEDSEDQEKLISALSDQELRAILDEKKPGCLIEVDGGINLETGKLCKDSGTDVLVAGSAFFGAADKALFLKETEG